MNNILHYGVKDCANCFYSNMDMGAFPCKECVAHSSWEPNEDNTNIYRDMNTIGV